jgi:alpha-L-rhamnosidase
VLQVRAMAGDIDGSLAMIREFWGGMLSLGATSFWEHFNIDWLENASRIDQLPVEGKVDVHKDCGEYCFVGLRHSLCHGWSGGPAAWLSRYVLGVRAAAPGFKKVIIDPRLGDLDYVKGSVPTPHGNIEVQCTMKNSKRELIYDLPNGVEVVEP